MWSDIYNFFEQFAGVSYDFSSDIREISGDTIFIDPVRWRNTVASIINNLQDALDIIEEYSEYLGEDMPSKRNLKKIVASYVLGELTSLLNSIKGKLNIEKTDISTFDNLEQQLITISEMIEMFVNTPLDEIVSKNLFVNSFVEDEDEEDNPLEILFGLYPNDVTNLSFTISSIRDDYFTQLDEDEA